MRQILSFISGCVRPVSMFGFLYLIPRGSSLPGWSKELQKRKQWVFSKVKQLKESSDSVFYSRNMDCPNVEVIRSRNVETSLSQDRAPHFRWFFCQGKQLLAYCQWLWPCSRRVAAPARAVAHMIPTALGSRSYRQTSYRPSGHDRIRSQNIIWRVCLQSKIQQASCNRWSPHGHWTTRRFAYAWWAVWRKT